MTKEGIRVEAGKPCGKTKALPRKQALIRAMEAYFGKDTKRIRHARTVLYYTELILRRTAETNPGVVVAAAVLHDIGIRNAEQKYGSSSATYQEQEGPPVAREILGELGYPESFIEEVCDIVGHHHHPRSGDTANFNVLYDADLLTNLHEMRDSKQDPPATAAFRTEVGRSIGRREGLTMPPGHKRPDISQNRKPAKSRPRQAAESECEIT